MNKPSTQPEPAMKCKGLPTFYGIFKEYQDECATMYRKSGWAEKTTEQYTSIIVNTICPNLKNHDSKLIDDYSKEDFEDAIKAIIASRKKTSDSVKEDYDEDTIRTFRRLIRTVVTVAYNNDQCISNVFADDFDEKHKEKLLRDYRYPNMQPKSLSVEQEFSLVQYLMGDLLVHGQSVGLLLMFAAGTRCAEACGASFEDIISYEKYPDLHCLRILETTSLNSNTLTIGGKTDNVYRYIPLPVPVYNILQKILSIRKAALASKLNPEDLDVGKLPIACKDQDYLRRCTSGDLTRAGKDAFIKIGMRSEFLTAINICLQQDQSSAEELTAEEEFALVEKEPTTYLLRRNFATHLHLLRLSDTEISYIIGHEIYDAKIKRGSLSNPDHLYRLKSKMDKRPILNDITVSPSVHSMQGNESYHFSGTHTQILSIPANASVTITASACVSSDAVGIQISNAPGSIANVHHLRNSQETGKLSRIEAGLNSYHTMYRNVIGDYVIGL